MVTLDKNGHISTTAHSNYIITRPLELQDEILYLTSLTLSTILTQSSTTSQMLRNCHKNQCNGYTKLNWAYLYNHWVKSYNYKIVRKPRLNTLLSSTYPKCDSCSVKCYIAPSRKWPNIAIVLEPIICLNLAAYKYYLFLAQP